MEETIRCPECGSIHIHAEKRGWNWRHGILFSGTIWITCLKCGRKFRPGQGTHSDVRNNDQALSALINSYKSVPPNSSNRPGPVLSPPTPRTVSESEAVVRFCNYCGKRLPGDGRFCGYCGREIVQV
jgi:ribosomal protein L24E